MASISNYTSTTAALRKSWRLSGRYAQDGYAQDGQAISPVRNGVDAHAHARGTATGPQFPARTFSRASYAPIEHPASSFGDGVWQNHFSLPFQRSYFADEFKERSDGYEFTTPFRDFRQLDAIEERFSKGTATMVAQELGDAPVLDKNDTEARRPWWKSIGCIRRMYGSAPYCGQVEDTKDGKFEDEFDSYPTGWTRAALMVCALVPYCMVSRGPFVLFSVATADMAIFQASLDDTIIGTY